MRKYLFYFTVLFFFSCSKDPLLYTLTTSANPISGGTVTPINKKYDSGDIASIIATPSPEYVFQNWIGLEESNSSVKLVMDSDKSITANFVKKNYSLITKIEGQGTINEKVIKIGGISNYNSGSIVELTAIPRQGWLFKKWEGDLVGTVSPSQIEIDKEKNVTAVFIKTVELNKLSTFLALGDSYTIGESVAVNDRWPVQFFEELKKLSTKMDSLRIIARTGWKVEELNQEITNLNIGPSYGLVSLQIGVNNQFQGQNANDFRPAFVKLLDRSISLAGDKNKKLFVLSVPDWGASGYTGSQNSDQISKEIDEFNSVIKTETEIRGVPFFDITPISRRARSDKTLIASDGLHPSAKMYKLWVEKIVNEISKVDLN
jgi:lysophospholipase L1-like esterase